jgi:hypothetical protein
MGNNGKILSGFQVGDTPGIGTFHDFFRRLWDADKPILRNPIHQPKKPPAKPGKKGEKAAPVAYKSTFTVGKDGVPICRAGFKMHPNGKDPLHEYLFYRCPAKYKKSGCFCDHPCSDSSYGRVVKLSSKDNPRLFNIPPRDSDEWKSEYNARTSSERCNKREKIDYKLEDGRHRSSWMWYCRLYSIMMCQHLDAWALSKTSSLKDLFCKAA